MDTGFQAQKKTSVEVHLHAFGAKAGLEHRNYPHDLNGLKFTREGTIPSLIPSDPIGDNRTT